MTERRRQPSNADLEQALAELASRLVYPPTPDLATTVRGLLATRPAARRRFHLPPLTLRRGIAFVTLALVLLATGLIALSPGVRSAVADRLGLKGVRITVVPTLPALPPASVRFATNTPAVGAAGMPAAGVATPAASATPVLLGANLQLGAQAQPDEAQARVQYRVLTPGLPELGQPDEVWLSQVVPGGQVAFVYAVRPGLPMTAQMGVGMLLTEFRGDIDPAFFGKLLGPGTRLEPVTVNGGRGWWIEGNPHLFFYRNANGQVRDEQIRLAGNTLLWEQGGLIFRLESAVSKDEALRIAESVR